MRNFLFIIFALFSLNSFASHLTIETSGSSAKLEDYVFYDFGTVFVNSRSVIRYTVTNNGVVPLTFSNAYVYGSDFSAVNSCTGILLPAAQCQFEISYWPLFEGISSGRFVLNFVENDNITLDVRGMARRY
jgi:hypothetical protein